LNAQTQRELQDLLQRVAPALAPATTPAVSVRVGQPSKEILAQAIDCNADVIVMGMRGLGSAQKLLLGSTSQHVLEGATVPVMVVPPPER
jgi:nucleotide-binding universal stress UspA family protein